MVIRRTMVALAILAGCLAEGEEPVADEHGPAPRGAARQTAPPTESVDAPSRTPARTSASLTVGAATVDVWPAYEPDPAPVAVHSPVLGHYAIGQAFADWDGDGDLDLYVTGGAAPSVLLDNQGDGTLVPLTNLGDAGLADFDTAGAAWADYDQDGDPDLLVAAHGGARLLRNDGPSGFSDVTDHAGVAFRGDGVMVAWGDFNGDSWVDAYLANHYLDRDVLLAGSASGKFTPVEITAEPEPSFAAAFVDYDDDGRPDLYTCVDHKFGNDLRRNRGNTFLDPRERIGAFVDVSDETTTGIGIDCMGLAIGDYDNDLDLDLYVSNIGYPHLLRSGIAQGKTRFDDVGVDAGVDFYAVSWGTIFFDFDNDGWLDLYLATQDVNPLRHNRLFHNLGDGTFEDVSLVSGASDGGWTYGVGAADLDGDGRLDLVIGNRGEGYRILRNTGGVGSDNHWLSVNLRGSGPVNRDAIGARVWVTTTEGDVRGAETRSGSSMGGGDQPRLHFGLGEASVDHVTIRWPDGTYETVDSVPTDTVWTHHYPD